MQALRSYCDAHHTWLIDTTAALVAHESPSDDKAAADVCGRELARRLAELGGRVETVAGGTAGDHAVAVFGSGPRQVMVLGHFDTVWPVGELTRQPWRHSDGMLYGPGVLDMKAGLAMGMLAVRALQARPGGLRGRVLFVCTSDEETGSAVSRALVEDRARQSDAVLVLEPALPDGSVKTARKGCGQYLVRARGVAAHAGIEPEKGASAVHELCRGLGDVLAWSDPSRGLTINVGTIRGGSRPNVVAALAEAEVDVRVASLRDGQEVDRRMRGLASAHSRVVFEVSGGIDRPPLERTDAVVALYRQASAVAGELGLALGEGATGGGSDGNFTAAIGVPTLDGLGAVGTGAHAVGECVDAVSLPRRAALVAGLIHRILEG